MGLNFTVDMDWGRLILLSLSKKRPKNQSPDTRGAVKSWLSQCTVAPAAFWKCIFWDTLYNTLQMLVLFVTWIRDIFLMKRNSISSLGREAVKSSCCTIYLFVCAISNGSLLANQLRVNSTQQKQFEMVNNDKPLINMNLVFSAYLIFVTGATGIPV